MAGEYSDEDYADIDRYLDYDALLTLDDTVAATANATPEAMQAQQQPDLDINFEMLQLNTPLNKPNFPVDIPLTEPNFDLDTVEIGGSYSSMGNAVSSSGMQLETLPGNDLLSMSMHTYAAVPFNTATDFPLALAAPIPFTGYLVPIPTGGRVLVYDFTGLLPPLGNTPISAPLSPTMAIEPACDHGKVPSSPTLSTVSGYDEPSPQSSASDSSLTSLNSQSNSRDRTRKVILCSGDAIRSGTPFHNNSYLIKRLNRWARGKKEKPRGRPQQGDPKGAGARKSRIYRDKKRLLQQKLAMDYFTMKNPTLGGLSPEVMDFVENEFRNAAKRKM